MGATAVEGAPRLPVVLLWHMHQPQYRDALSGEYVLPWTVLHALKDYSDMAAHLEHNPAARAVVNFTPVLLEQLEEYSQRIAQYLRDATPLRDRVLALLSDAPLPTDSAARAELIRACLRAQRQRMIERFEPFRELADLAPPFLEPERAGWASDQFITDLAVWYHLAWLGESIRLTDERVKILAARQRGYSAEDKRLLLQLINDVLANLVPRWRALAEQGRVELSTTPYAHPILPLLHDFRAARESIPDAILPVHLGYPGGAQRAGWQMAEAVRVFGRVFGFRPVGCWPSEGAVSQVGLATIEQFGFRWAATSANVLRASTALDPVSDVALAPNGTDERAAVFNRVYLRPGGELACFFRHDTLSDAIGFQYATWHGDDAAANLAGELGQLASFYAGQPERIVLIALDGENAWEHYPDNGWHFLKALYAALGSHPQLELTTLSDYLQRRKPRSQALDRIVAGSWVHGTLATWIGDPDKNAAWDLLCVAKQAFDRVVVEGALSESAVAAAERQLALCESSDWFWWFGDYNPVDAVSSFDQLYRRQLLTLYRMLGVEPPANLSLPVSVGHGNPEGGGTMRRGATAT